MKKQFFVFIVYFSFIFLQVSCQNNDHKHEGHNHKHEGHDHKHESKKEVSDDCKNCGMPSQEPNWQVKHTNEQQEIAFFCSPKCYLDASNTEKSYQYAENLLFSIYDEKNKMIDAKKAFFINGTTEKNPMNQPDFIVTDNQEKAKKLLTEKKGKEILSFEQVAGNR